MNIKNRFLFFFTLYLLLIIMLISALAIYFIEGTFALIGQASNAALVSAMSGRILLKTGLTFLSLIVLVIASSIPIGLWLMKLISRSYLKIFQDLHFIARDRLKVERHLSLEDTEQTVLEKYLRLLILDQEKLKDYEMIKSWKDGARMLMHELKNPLTPLQLSIEMLAISPDLTPAQTENIQVVLSSVKDMENIFYFFKKFVNIEFKPKDIIQVEPVMREIIAQQRVRGNEFPIRGEFPEKNVLSLCEPTLLKMLFNNLINNGMEANPGGFYLEIKKIDNGFIISFVTRDRRVGNPAQLFRLGYSDKDEKRGFGLFLCKKISDYLDLNLNFVEEEYQLAFTIKIKEYLNERG